MLTWVSRPIKIEDLPQDLNWQVEKHNPDYRVHLAFARKNGFTYRRLTFPGGESMLSLIEYTK